MGASLSSEFLTAVLTLGTQIPSAHTKPRDSTRDHIWGCPELNVVPAHQALISFCGINMKKVMSNLCSEGKEKLAKKRALQVGKQYEQRHDMRKAIKLEKLHLVLSCWTLK